MARWIPTKRQKYGVGECLPRPTPTRAPPSPRALAPPSWRTLGRRVPLVLQPRESSPPWLLKVLLGLGTLILPSEPQLQRRHCGSASGPLCRRWPARGRTWDGALCACPYPDPTRKPQSPSPSLPGSAVRTRRHKQNEKPKLRVEMMDEAGSV